MGGGVYTILNIVGWVTMALMGGTIFVAMIMNMFWKNSAAKFLVLSFLLISLLVTAWNGFSRIFYEFIYSNLEPNDSENISQFMRVGTSVIYLAWAFGFLLLTVGVSLLTKQINGSDDLKRG